MIKLFRIINSRGLTVVDKVLNKDQLFEEHSTTVDLISSSLFADLQTGYPKKMNLTQVETKNLPDPYSCYFTIENYDLFLFFSDTKLNNEELSSNQQIQQLIKERQIERSSFKGIVVADFDDIMGPVPIFSSSPLNEAELAILSVQGTTVLGMSMENLPNYVVGPVPIPSKPNLSCLIRGFQRPAPHSEDPRIQRGGRPATIFIILSASTSLDKESNTFIDAFLQQWILSDAIKEVFDEKDLNEMSISLEQVLVLAQDLVKVRDVQVNKLRDLLKFYTTENLMLKQKLARLEQSMEAQSKTPQLEVLSGKSSPKKSKRKQPKNKKAINKKSASKAGRTKKTKSASKRK